MIVPQRCWVPAMRNPTRLTTPPSFSVRKGASSLQCTLRFSMLLLSSLYGQGMCWVWGVLRGIIITIIIIQTQSLPPGTWDTANELKVRRTCNNELRWYKGKYKLVWGHILSQDGGRKLTFNLRLEGRGKQKLGEECSRLTLRYTGL